MRKVLAFAASTAISMAAWSVASANGTVKAEECPKPVHHKHHAHHKQHHHHHKHHAEPVACAPCPQLHSGFFAGLKGGYGWMKGKVKRSAQATNTSGAVPVVFTSGQTAQLGADGGEIGLFLGYDRYFPNKWMLGIEGGAQWTDLSGKTSAFVNTNDGRSVAFKTRLKSDWSYDIALRLGRKVYECSMWYVKAGAQFTHFKTSTNNLVTVNGVTNTLARDSHKKKYRTGFLTGFGVEVPVACHWSLGAEYNFTWYQRVTASRAATNGTTDFVKARVRPYENQLVARLIWKQ